MQKKIRNNKGFTLIELVVVMVILALLAAVAVPKFLDLQKQAEAASVKKVLGNMRSALSSRVAQALVNGEDLRTLAYNGTAALDPMADLLSNKPESYLGVVGNQPAEPKGVWYDRSTGATDHWVMYKVKNADIITGGWSNAGTNIINRIEVVTDDTGEVVGLELSPSTYTYTWNY